MLLQLYILFKKKRLSKFDKTASAYLTYQVKVMNIFVTFFAKHQTYLICRFHMCCIVLGATLQGHVYIKIERDGSYLKRGQLWIFKSWLHDD